MKTKLFLLFAAIVMLTNHAGGQSTSDTYVVGTSIDAKCNSTGFLKYSGQANDYFITTPITFGLCSKEKGFDIPLVHYNVIGKRRIIFPMEVSELDSLNAIDADDFIRNKTKEQADQWGKEHINKTIWVIDRNDFYWESSKQCMLLIETTVTPETYPDPPLIMNKK